MPIAAIRRLLCRPGAAVLRRALAALPTAAVGLLLAGPAAAEGVLLRVHGGGGQAWLLGSLHFGSEDLYPLGERVERAFAAADRLMVEVNLLDLEPRDVARAVESRGSYPSGESLRAHISEPQWQRLFRASRSLEIPLRVFERQRPWLASLTLTSAFLERHGLHSSRGVDQHFMRRARRAGLPILQMESFETQMDLLAGIPESEQVLMLEDTLEQVETQRSLPMDLLLAWRRGDAAELKRLLVDGMGASEQGRALAQRLLVARNGPMAEQVAAELTRGGTVFVVVGAAHLLGESSIAEELRRRGLEVR